MERNLKILQQRRILATSEYRGLSKIEKGLKLINDENVPNKMAADILEIGHRNLDRAKVAFQEGRELGKNGRPPLFNEEETLSLVGHLKALPADLRITYKELRNQVRTFISTEGSHFS
jgi:hypothetical protein